MDPFPSKWDKREWRWIARFLISDDPWGRMITSFAYGSLRFSKVKPIERSEDAFLGAVDLITNKGDVAAGVMLGSGFQGVETGEDEDS